MPVTREEDATENGTSVQVVDPGKCGKKKKTSPSVAFTDVDNNPTGSNPRGSIEEVETRLTGGTAEQVSQESQGSFPSVDFDALLPHIGEMGRYQLGLYLLMCIPATLPAAFLAFNQVFLSAAPDHWCKVPELETQNLSRSHIIKLSIPERRFPHTDYREFEQCRQYDVNFTKVFHDNGEVWPQEPDPEWPKVFCKNGWVFDQSEYDNTLVTEVRSFRHT